MYDSFDPLPNRDAADSIKGFVYQADLTVERWLDLDGDEVLELECGEDLDRISPMLRDGSADWQRILEQIKARTAPLTLRSSGATAALANAIAYRAGDSGQRLLFRYTTNASVGTERPSPLVGRVPAIDAWEQIRRGECTAIVQREYVFGILSILRNAVRPDGVADDVWSGFTSFMENAARHTRPFVDLIRVFEWSTKVVDPHNMSAHVQDLLRQRGFAHDEADAAEKYERLFVHVFRVLCRRGRKRLTTEDRRSVLGRPSLNPEDRALLDRLMLQMRGVEQRVSLLETTQVQVTALLRSISFPDPVRQLADAIGFTPPVITPPMPLPLDVPPLPVRVTRRGAAVSALVSAMDQHAWTAIADGADTGKTTLAILLAESVPMGAMWVRFRENIPAADAGAQLDRSCSEMLGQSTRTTAYARYSQLCRVLGHGALIVLDNLPRMQPEDDLTRRLLVLTQACRAYGVKLLSTSPHPLPREVRELLGDAILHELHTPHMDDNDIADLLDLYGAPDTPERAAITRVIGQLTCFHPPFIVAAIRYLAEHRWQDMRAALEALFAGEHLREVNEETTHRLIGAITDDADRDLLYRLSLTFQAFSVEDACALAEVDPEVSRPRERLDRLMGDWVQNDIGNRLQVSQMVRALGGMDVPSGTRKRCHAVLGRRIVRRRGIDQYDALAAIGHYRQAEQYDKAAIIHISALGHLLNLDLQVSDAGLSNVWALDPLPTEMGLNLRIYLRALQVAIRHRRGMDTSFPTADLNRLLQDKEGYDDWAILPAAIHMPTHANRYLIEALRRLPTMRGPGGAPLRIPEDAPLEWIIWWHTDLITTADQLREWMAIVEQLTPEQRARAFSGRLGDAGCLRVSQQLWLREERKPHGEQRWPPILETLDALATWALDLGEPLLWACAVRVRVIILAERCRDLASAEAVARQALADGPDDPRVSFLLHSCLGRQYLVAQRYDPAIAELDRALSQPTDIYSFLRMDALLDASRAAGQSDTQAALTYAERAVLVAETHDDIPRIERVRALTEGAVAEWLASGNIAEAYDNWDTAAQELLNCRSESDEWRDLFVMYGHASGYFARLAATGRPPEMIPGGDPYMAPYRGMFAHRSTARASLYNPRRDCYLLTQLAMYARGIGEDERAAYWTARGLDLARETNQLLAQQGLLTGSIVEFVANDRFDEVLDYALEAGAIMVLLAESHAAGEDIIDLTVDVDAAIASLPQERRIQAEHHGALLGLLPIAYKLAWLSVHDASSARESAARIAAICREISGTSAQPWFWTAAAAIIEGAYVHTRPSDQLANLYRTDAPEYNSLLHAMSYIGASLQPDCVPEQALAWHVIVLSGSSKFLDHAAYRRIAVPFLADYWMRMLETKAFRFRWPSLTGKEVQRALSIQPNVEYQEARAILRAVFCGLSVRLPEDAVEWLQGRLH